MQIFALQGYQSWIKNNEILKLYLKQGSDFASKDQHQARGSSTLGIGIVKTLIPKDEEFCMESDCFYAIRVETGNVQSYRFTTVLFNRLVKQNIWQASTLLDELREGDDYAIYDITTED